MPNATSRSVLIVGGDSRLAKALAYQHHQRGDTVVRTTRRNADSHHPFLDLARPDTFDAVVGNYDVAYLCASVTSRQACENDPEGTARLNVTAPGELLRRLAACGTFSVIFSTNMVFDGELPNVPVSAPVSPRCHYGEQKVALENLVKDQDLPGAIVRVGKMLDGQQPTFETWRHDLLEGKPIYPFSDMVFAPLWITQVAGVVTSIGASKRSGIYHLSAENDLTYAEAALHLARNLGVDPSLVRPRSCKTSLPSDFHNPRHTTLLPAPRPEFVRPPATLAINELCAAFTVAQAEETEVAS